MRSGQEHEAQFAGAALHQVGDGRSDAAHQAEADPGTGERIAAQERGEEVAGHVVGTGDLQFTAGPFAYGAKVLQAPQLAQDARPPDPQLFPLGCGLDTPRRALDQADPQHGLQGLDLAGDGGLGPEKPGRSPAEVAFLADHQEGFQQLDVHYAYLA